MRISDYTQESTLLKLKGIATIAIATILSAFLPGAAANAVPSDDSSGYLLDIDAGQDGGFIGYEGVFYDNDASIDEATVVYSDGTDQYINGDAFDTFGYIYLQTEGFSAELDILDGACQPVPSDNEIPVSEAVFSCSGSTLVGPYTIDHSVGLTFRGNWIKFDVTVSSAQTLSEDYRIVIGGNTGHDGDAYVEYSSDSKLWLTSSSAGNASMGGGEPLLGFRTSEASTLYGEADSGGVPNLQTWENGDTDYYFASQLKTMTSTPTAAYALEVMLLGYATGENDYPLIGPASVTSPTATTFQNARACGIEYLNNAGSFGSQYPYFVDKFVTCTGRVVPTELDTTTAVVPSSNPKRAIGEKFTFTGQNLTRVQSVVCNGVSAQILAQGKESLTIRVPSGLTGEVNCDLRLVAQTLTSTKAFTIIDGPYARYVKSVKSGKVNIRIYNAVGQKVRILVDGVRKTVVTPKKIDTFVQLRNVSVGKHKLVIKTGGKELLNRSFRAR